MTRPAADTVVSTRYLALAVGWVVICSFQHGYHIAALNQIQAVLTCKVTTDVPPANDGGLSLCVPMTDAQFGILTAMFTSLNVDREFYSDDDYGEIVGLGCGIGICSVPVYLAEVSPSAIQGRIGVLNQLGIVIGIFAASAFGLVLPALDLAMGFSQLWCRGHRAGRTEEATKAASRLWSVSKNVDPDEREALLESEVEAHVPDEATEAGEHRPAINVPSLLASGDLHRPLALVLVAMFVQQASGINAVMYFSNDILSRVVPREIAAYTSLGITVLNAIMTFPPIFLVDRLGRKPLLMMSIMGAIISSAALGISLDAGITSLSSIAVLGFVASFAIGLGPVPYLMISELTPYYAVSAMSSLSMAVNWSTNFVIGAAFLPLRNFLAKLSFGGSPAEGSGEGRVFYVFVLAMIACSMYLSAAWKPTASHN
ncbi:Sugar (and other) transporter [Ceratobasidium sp. AG-Ba]|nr:Sugar (and other) transporter [Ceratobasidium sp. AG-Ba]